MNIVNKQIKTKILISIIFITLAMFINIASNNLPY